MRNKHGNPFVNVGLSSLLVVFLVLCLVIFAALSLAGANSDAAYSRRMADRRTTYYDACSRAEQMLDELDEALEEAGFDGDFSALGVTRQEDLLTWQTPVSDTQALSVCLILTPHGEHFYEIETWKLITVAEPSESEPLPLMPMGGVENGA